jgi:hypothetical protein
MLDDSGRILRSDGLFDAASQVLTLGVTLHLCSPLEQVRVTAQLWGGRMMMRPGTPITVAPSGTLVMTSVLAAILAPLPTLILPIKVAPVPM